MKNFECKEPKSPGLIFLYFKKIKISELLDRYVDTGELINIRSTKSYHEQQWRDSILNNEYDEKNKVPPVVTELNELIAGRHRVAGHKLAGKDYIIVAVCKFINYKNNIPKHWITVYQSLENKKTYYQNERTNKDIIHVVKTQISLKTINLDYNEILQSLRDQQVTPYNLRKQLAKEILDSYSNKKTDEIATSYNTAEKVEFFEKNYSDQNYSTLNNHTINEDTNKLYLLKEFKKIKDRYYTIIPHEIFNILNQYKERDILPQVEVLFSINQDLSKNVTKVRTDVKFLIENYEQYIKDTYNLITSEKYKRPVLTSIPQIKKDFNLN